MIDACLIFYHSVIIIHFIAEALIHVYLRTFSLMASIKAFECKECLASPTARSTLLSQPTSVCLSALIHILISLFKVLADLF